MTPAERLKVSIGKAVAAYLSEIGQADAGKGARGDRHIAGGRRGVVRFECECGAVVVGSNYQSGTCAPCRVCGYPTHGYMFCGDVLWEDAGFKRRCSDVAFRCDTTQYLRAKVEMALAAWRAERQSVTLDP